MRRTAASVFAALALATGLLTAAPTGPATAAPTETDRLEAFTGQVTPEQLQQLRALGLDHEDIALGRFSNGKVAVEVVMGSRQAAALRAKGLALTAKTVTGQSRRLAAAATVFKPYLGAGNHREEMLATAAEHPGIATTVDLGRSVKGTPITAIRVTKGAATQRTPSRRPAVVFQATQHAREWITPENVRRQYLHFVDNYGTDPEITKIVDTTDLWFVPVVNVDGYDFTFTEGNRLWRKNLRDNDADGEIRPGDGVDPNRNFDYKWGYDNEGSSPAPDGETYRGPSPNSEPETRVQDALVRRLRPKYMVNYHSAAQLLLYGVGWQTNTPSPDDHVYEALVGTPDEPAVEGYTPELGAQLYTTNGETDGYMSNKYDVLTITPEMSTCQTVSAVDPDDQWNPDDCPSVFSFPDDEALIQAEFEKNLPLAVATARSAHHPDTPVSVTGLTTPDLVAHPFAVSYGTTQPVAVEARRSLKGLQLEYSVNGRRPRRTDVREWRGGETFGRDNNTYYAEFRGTVRGTRPGDTVEVRFSARKGGARVSSEPFTYTVADDIGGEVLVLSAEDVTGISPVQDATSARYAEVYAKALAAAGHTSDEYDVDAYGRTAPDPLGVLSHYDAVIWETGDDIVTRAVGQPGGTAAKLSLDIETAVRSYLNEGGKLLFTGKYAGLAPGADGAYYYEPDVPAQPECAERSEPPCLPLFNDFLQYYLGAYTYVDGGGTDADGAPYAVKGSGRPFSSFASTLNGGDSADNQDHTASFLTTSSFLPKAQFPQFASSAPLEWDRPGGAPYDPRTGSWYVYSNQADSSYKRLSRTVDLTGRTDGTLTFQTSYDTEADWDHVFVEAHTVGEDDWTTLPDANGHTTQATGESCAAGWRTIHPFLDRYQGADCSPTGTTGAWHAASGGSGGWQEWSVDLTAFAGRQVELSITYVSDWSTQGIGVFVDDAVVTSGGATISDTSFETDLGGWTVSGPPAGSTAAGTDWVRSQTAFEEGAGVVTDDTVYLGFGVEGLTTDAARTSIVKRAMRHLLPY